MTLIYGLFLIAILALYCISTSIFKQQNQALAQQYIQTIKSRNLVIDLGNGVKTNAQLTLPSIGKDQVLLVKDDLRINTTIMPNRLVGPMTAEYSILLDISHFR